jgi:hypothetical protein
MRRPMLSTSLLSLALLLAGASAAAAASLTRIETRPFYGATVTIEEGVRVFRPLPVTKNFIINPDGKTPLNLTFEERNITVHQHQYIYGMDGGDSPVVYGGGFSPGFFDGRRRFRPHHRRVGGHIIHVPSAVRGGGFRAR